LLLELFQRVSVGDRTARQKLMNVNVHVPRKASRLVQKKRSTANLVVQRLAREREPLEVPPRTWKASLTAALADFAGFGHDVSKTAPPVRSRKERAHAMLVTQDLLVGCMVALQHLAIGHGESHAPKDRGLKAAVAATDGRQSKYGNRRVPWLTTHS
jgi:hypothetical protein